MGYTYDLSTDVGKIRLMISDTDITDAHFTDEELDALLDLAEYDFTGTPALYEAAGLALDSWAASSADDIKEERIGDYSYSKGGKINSPAAERTAKADKYHRIARESAVFEWSELDFEEYGESEE